VRESATQLALAAQAGTTTRHLSFLETGRSRPSQEMVLRVGQALGIPLREQNRLLEAAGLPPDLDDADLAPFRAAIEQLLTAHLPYPPCPTTPAGIRTGGLPVVPHQRAGGTHDRDGRAV
jgi:transcriptional regulator with XRE-family HTH domain